MKMSVLFVFAIVLIVCLVIPPLCIHWIFGGFSETNACAGLEAPEILSYTGTIIGVLGSVFAATIAILSERQARRQKEKDEKEKRLNEIRPSLTVRFRQNEDGMAVLIGNLKDSPALSVYLEDQFLFSMVKNGEQKERKVEFIASDDPDALYLYSLEGKMNEEGYPSKMTLYYMDIDRNTIEQDFVYDGNGYYGSNDNGCYL